MDFNERLEAILHEGEPTKQDLLELRKLFYDIREDARLRFVEFLRSYDEIQQLVVLVAIRAICDAAIQHEKRTGDRKLVEMIEETTIVVARE